MVAAAAPAAVADEGPQKRWCFGAQGSRLPTRHAGR